MKTTIEITNGVKIYWLMSFGDDIFLENEQGEAMTIPEKDLFDILDDYFQREF